MSRAAGARRALASPPRPPELPEGARPAWPPWYGFAAMGIGTGVLLVATVPLLGVILWGAAAGTPTAVATLVLLLVQDAVYVGTAAWLALRRSHRLRAWQFGLRAAPLRRTAALTAAVTVGVLAFELAYAALLGIGDGGADDLGADGGAVAALAVSLAVIVVAPVSEELFFRAFFYRALRNRVRRVPAALANGAVFGVLHFQGVGSLAGLPVIALFAVAACLVYEATGTIFSAIAIHAVFNTFATAGSDAGVIVPLVVGLAVLAGCLVAARRLGPAPSPFGAALA